MSGAEGALEDHVPSVDELTSLMEGEAADEVGGKSRDVAEDVDQRIGAGLDRVKKHLETPGK